MAKVLCVAIGDIGDRIDLVKLIPHACYHQLFKFILITLCSVGWVGGCGKGVVHRWGIPKMKRTIWFMPREK